MTTPLIDAGCRERADRTLTCIHCGGRAAVETYDHHRHDGSWRVEIVRCYLPNRKAKGAEPCPETKTETRMETTFEMPKSNVSKPMITPSYEHIQFARDLSCTHARIREVALVSNSSLYRWMGGKAVSLDVHNRILKALGQLKAAEVATNAGVAPISGTVRSDFAENHLAPETLPEGSKKGEERAEIEHLKARNYNQSVVIEGLRSDVERFESALKDALHQRDNAAFECESLRKKAEELKTVIFEAKSDLAVEVEHLRSENLKLRSQDYDDLVKVAKAEIARLAGLNEANESEIIRLRKERDANFDEATQIKNRFLESAAEVEALRQEVFESGTEFDRLTYQNGLLKAEIDELKTYYERQMRLWQESSAKVPAEVEQLKAERDALKAETERLSGIVERHREGKSHGVLGPICQQRDEALAVNRDLRSEVARLTGIVDKYAEANDRLQAERDELQSEIERLEKQCDDLWCNQDPSTTKILAALQTWPRPFARQFLRTAWSMIDLHEAQEQLADQTSDAMEGRR